MRPAPIDGETVAFASYHIFDVLERPEPQCRVTAMVVRHDRRRRGVARELLQAIESAARERGCFRLEVTTRPQRTEALRFYAALGFREQLRRLVKML